MFHIEDKADDLAQMIPLMADYGLEASRKHPIGKLMTVLMEVGQLSNEISEEVGTLAGMLRRTYREMEDMSHCEIPVYFRHINGIKELDEQAQEVVAAILQELCGDINYQLRQLTKYDRVDND